MAFSGTNNQSRLIQIYNYLVSFFGYRQNKGLETSTTSASLTTVLSYSGRGYATVTISSSFSGTSSDILCAIRVDGATYYNHRTRTNTGGVFTLSNIKFTTSIIVRIAAPSGGTTYCTIHYGDL